MLKLLVAGGLDADGEDTADISAFAKMLGAEIIRQGHLLLNSCRNDLDRIVAQGACDQLIEQGENPKSRLISYVLENQNPVHDFGKVKLSGLVDWELGNPHGKRILRIGARIKPALT